ncbi:cytoplasmic phosphatidylinositol transfer protein 1-like [Seriola lalandi dorsalis]|uniref:cytoplasmic phosphatidylinositol transfer protein 1-like n=1 Tax=Seriola lalandi dorsalis TaxID=1841481 RepID=UPI000C6F7DFA|nr:cytoplasmic phosphatidylinositol transfer protein 1-like [Seriola lalandi dorsalis]
MLMKEYRICMPLTVDEYRIGQLYMISKHSCEQSGGGEGVEVVRNELDVHPQHGPGQLTEKRIYLSSKLPSWAKAFVPRIFYVTEKAWNLYPFTITEYSVSFLPKFSIRIETRFENNNGDNDNVFGDTPTPAKSVSFLDILSDPIPEKHYKESENIRDILLVGHRQAVAWIDEWHGLSLEEVREYERAMQEKTNSKVKSSQNTDPPAATRPAFSRSISVTDERSLKKMGVTTAAMSDPSASSVSPSPIRLNSTPE